MTFRPNKKSEQRRKSAVALIKLILMNKTPEMDDRHRKQLLDVLVWKITEQHGKHNTIYKSAATSLIRCDGANSRHDHVHTRKNLIERLLENPNEIETILNDAIACVVTPEEHDKLTKDKQNQGWKRYKEAGIDVIDMRTGEKVALDKLL